MADIIDTLLALDDNALMAKLGLDAKLDTAKKTLAEAAALTGDARKKVADSIAEDFKPRTPYPEDWKWRIKDAQRCEKTAAEEMCDCSPASLDPS